LVTGRIALPVDGASGIRNEEPPVAFYVGWQSVDVRLVRFTGLVPSAFMVKTSML
jgi:hypothetical protein